MEDTPAPLQDRPFLVRMMRLVKLKMIVPILRSKHPPEYTARGVAHGLAWGFTPLVGVQLYIVAVIWAACRPFERLKFAILPAMAWVWVSNIFTLGPMYYMFYVTGQIMRGHWHDVAGYEGFVGRWHELMAGNQGFWETILSYLKVVAMEQGVSLLLGCIPYMILFGWLGYVWSLKFVIRRREAMQRRAEKRALKAKTS